MRHVLLFAVLAMGLAVLHMGVERSSAEVVTDPVRQQLDDAKVAHADVLSKANTTLLAAFDAQIKALAATGAADGIKILSAQKAAFMSSGALPDSPLMRDAVRQYQQTAQGADATLADAYGAAIDDYTRAGNFDAAGAARHEQRLLREGAVADGGSAAPTPAAIAAQLEQGKQKAKQALDDAKKALLAEIDGHIDDATRAGDLTTVETLQKVRTTAAVDGTIAADVKDAGAISARKHYQSAVKAANAQLALAYQKAVRDYTRAHDLTEARDTQNELASLGLTTTTDLGFGEGAYKLTRQLPDFLTSKDSVFEPLPRLWGIVVPQDRYIRTTAGNFLGKDFTCDIWFYMVKDLPKTQIPALIGLGEGTTNITNGGPQDAIYLEINPPNKSDGEVSLHKRLASNKVVIGHIKDYDTYIARIEKAGDSVTFAIGTEENGKFAQDIATTVDIKSAGSFLNDSNAHLFFGSGGFSQIRIASNKPPAVAVTPVVASPALSTAAPVSVAPTTRALIPVPEIKPLVDTTGQASTPKGMDLTSATRTINDIYKDDIGTAKTPPQRLVLAKKFLKVGVETQNDPAGRFVLLTKAMDMAAQAGDIDTAFSAITELGKNYQIDSLKMRMDVLSVCSKDAQLPAAVSSENQQAGKLADEAIELDRYDLAEKAADLALVAARRSNDTSAIQQATVRVDDVHACAAAFGNLKAAQAVLADKPSDPDANLAVGKFECFFKGNWEHGLSMLALSSDPALKSLAAQDIAGASGADDQVKLGDAWWDLAEKNTGLLKTHIQQRAGKWYSAAVSKLTGLAQAKVQKRLAECAPATVTPHFVGLYRIVSKSDGLYLSITSANKNRGNVVHASKANNAGNEQWMLDPISGYDGVRIVSKYSNLCISVREGSEKAGTDIIEWAPRNIDANAGPSTPTADNWRVEPIGDSFKIVNQATGQCLTCQKGTVAQEPWDGSDGQLWHIEPVK